MKYKLVKDYKDNKDLRKSFNKLTIESFGIDFEEWYKKGYWNECYIPYSFLDKGQVIANASANRMKLKYGEKSLNAIQIGTVSTMEEYRKQGLAKKLVEEIEKSYPKTDFYYLFANESARGFYEKCGYKRIVEKNYHFELNRVKMEALKEGKNSNIRKLDIENADDQKLLQSFVNNREYQSNGFGVKGDAALLNFYLLFVYTECIYYNQDNEMIMIVSYEDGELTLHDIFYHERVVIDSIFDLVSEIIMEFINIDNNSEDGIQDELLKVNIDFKPVVGDENLIQISDKIEEDCVTFVKLNNEFEFGDIRFPGLSHA